MNNAVVIKTTKLIYPQIYAYTLPEISDYKGWVKIGYTERKNVDERIQEQTHTAAIRLKYKKLWSAPAKFLSSEKWFKDHQFHAYLRSQNRQQHPNSEWFYYNGYLDESLNDFHTFREFDASQSRKQKLSYQLRPEQEAAVIQTLAYAQKNNSGEFLWNAKPRFGKTLTTYDFARRLQAKMVLIVTNRPAIANSWFDDYEKFIGWQTDYAFVSESDSLKDRPVMSREDFLKQQSTGKGDLIAFISLQDLKGAISFGGKYDKLSWVKNLEWDLLVIDEAHEGVDTFKTDIAFDNITRKFTLHLSGTPFKAVASGKFAQNEIYNWTYADEQAAKANWDERERNNPYENLPQLNLFSYQMSRMITDTVNQGADVEGKNLDFAFDLNEFFATNESGKFIYEKEVEKWLDTLSRNEKYPFSTIELRQELKHTFWLLNRVASARALQRMLKKHPVFKEYKVILAAGDGRSEEGETFISQAALDRVKNAISKHEKTITLSVGQLTTGVTIPEWTGVLMLSNLQSPSLYMQAAFRAQNPWKYSINGEEYRKERAYVFDFAPERTLVIYDEFANNLSLGTADGAGTTDDRRENIKELINFFPVIAEDNAGKMVELDVDQVLTIPKYIKAREVVKRGFMSNLLFQNISGIFASTEVREILEQLNPVEIGKVTPRKGSETIDTKNVVVDEEGNAIVDHSIVIAESNARFGQKIYKTIQETTEKIVESEQGGNNLSTKIKTAFVEQLKGPLKELAKEHKVSLSEVDRESNAAGEVIAREIEVIQAQNKIKHKEAETEYKKIVAEAKYDESKIKAAEAQFAARQNELNKEFETQISDTIEKKSEELVQNSTKGILERGEEKKKNHVEDEVRARLRGFSRTIPSFLMAYGESDTTLANFDHHIKDEVFKEVTGISLDQFRALRDTYNFFDETVFNQSVIEFLNKRRELANYFIVEQEEDIFDYIPPQQTNQIFTPRKVVNLMLDKLEEENPGLFSDPTKTFADLYMKSGLYITEIVKRLYKGLESKIPQAEVRLKHILEKQVYGFAPTEIIYNIARNYILGFDERSANINAAHIVHLDTLPYAKGELNFEEKCQELFGVSEMKFDVVVGNPPYQEQNAGENNQAPPVYHYFYELAEQIGKQYVLISPARFLSEQGATPKEWNKKMLMDKHLNVKYFNSNSLEVFPNNDIRGGIVILFRNEEKIFGEIGTFIPYFELKNIFQKVEPYLARNLSELVYSPDSYRFNDRLFEENANLIGRTDKSHAKALASSVFSRYPEIFFHEKPNDNQEYIRVYGRLNSERIYTWLSRKFINNHENLDKWKVFIPGANGSGVFGESLSTPIIAPPAYAHTQTFVSIGSFDSKFEALSLLKYIKSKFARSMLGIMKKTHNNQAKITWSKIPLQDFTPNSDIDWSKSIPEIDQQLYKKYGLTQEEINFIEEKVKPME